MRRWVWDPHTGGVKIHPAVRERTERRIRAYAESRYAGKFTRLGIRFRGEGRLYIEGQMLRRRLYDVFLGSISLPHWGTVERYPM